MEFSESTPIAFDADATTELAFCAEAPIDSRITTSAAPVSILSIRAPPRTRLPSTRLRAGCVRLLYLRRGEIVYRGNRRLGQREKAGPKNRTRPTSAVVGVGATQA